MLVDDAGKLLRHAQANNTRTHPSSPSRMPTLVFPSGLPLSFPPPPQLSPAILLPHPIHAKNTLTYTPAVPAGCPHWFPLRHCLSPFQLTHATPTTHHPRPTKHHTPPLASLHRRTTPHGSLLSPHAHMQTYAKWVLTLRLSAARSAAMKPSGTLVSHSAMRVPEAALTPVIC